MSDATFWWLLTGGVLCLCEAIVPTYFIALVMGMAAIAVAPFAPNLPGHIQVLTWALLSLGFFGISRSFVKMLPPKQARSLDDTEAKTLTEILPGQTGRVYYEGQSWLAKCQDPTAYISADQTVQVLDREGTMLIIQP